MGMAFDKDWAQSSSWALMSWGIFHTWFLWRLLQVLNHCFCTSATESCQKLHLTGVVSAELEYSWSLLSSCDVLSFAAPGLLYLRSWSFITGYLGFCSPVKYWDGYYMGFLDSLISIMLPKLLAKYIWLKILWALWYQLLRDPLSFLPASYWWDPTSTFQVSSLVLRRFMLMLHHRVAVSSPQSFGASAFVKAPE